VPVYTQQHYYPYQNGVIPQHPNLHHIPPAPSYPFYPSQLINPAIPFQNINKDHSQNIKYAYPITENRELDSTKKSS
jgi:hypothetical protein